MQSSFKSGDIKVVFCSSCAERDGQSCREQNSGIYPRYFLGLSARCHRVSVLLCRHLTAKPIPVNVFCSGCVLICSPFLLVRRGLTAVSSKDRLMPCFNSQHCWALILPFRSKAYIQPMLGSKRLGSHCCDGKGLFLIGPSMGWSHLMPAYKWKAWRIAYAAGRVNSACSVAGKLNAAKMNGTLHLH